MRVAAIDIGSNSIRGVVAEVAPDGSYRIVDDERFQTRLAAGLTGPGMLAPERIEASLVALEQLVRIAEARGAATIRAVATAAVRTAANGRDFLAAARDRLGLTVEIIDGETEGRFAFASAAANFELPDPACVIDIGGGSLEIVIAYGGQIAEIHSLPLGAVRLHAELPVDEDPPSPRALKRLRAEVREALSAELDDDVPHIPTVIGSGGTITSLVGVSVAARGGSPISLQGAEASAREIRDTFDRLSAMRSAARARVPGLAAYRADTVVPGGVVITEVMRIFGAERILANQKGLREGILIDTIARIGRGSAPPPLRETALRFGERCHFDRPHAEHVTANALALFDALASGTAKLPRRVRELLDARNRELLEAGALLHDVGYLIGHDKHHRHAWHIIHHASLPGLTAREHAIVAALARYHRGSDPKPTHEAWTRLADEDRDRTRLLAGILRVADGLDRSHRGAISGTVVTGGPDRINIGVSGSGDLSVELNGARAKAGLLASALGADVTIEQAAATGR